MISEKNHCGFQSDLLRPVRVLHLLPALGCGGVDRIVYDYSIRLADDIHFDFVVPVTNKGGFLEPLLREKGCRIFYFSPFRKGIFKALKSLDRIMRHNKYDIIHTHVDCLAFPSLLLAWKNGIKIRIAHSHSNKKVSSVKEYIKRIILVKLTKIFSTALFACGRDACICFWGRRVWNRKKCFIMKNSINTADFEFDKDKRALLRAGLGIKDDCFTIGSVARFSAEKNHEFLIDVFADIAKKRPEAVLLLAGSGDLEDDIRKKVKNSGLEKSVIFCGERNDVPDLLNVMDVFVLPSLHEGFPVSLVEVQANGLPAVVSDAVTTETKLSDNIKYISLSSTPDEWSNVICCSKREETKTANAMVVNAGYDINNSAKELLQHYKKLYIAESCSVL